MENVVILPKPRAGGGPAAAEAAADGAGTEWRKYGAYAALGPPEGGTALTLCHSTLLAHNLRGKEGEDERGRRRAAIGRIGP